MTAAVLEECGKPLQLLDLEIPKLKRGQVLVKIAYSAICRSQMMEIGGHRGTDKWLPHLLGHEASGTVINVGADVTKVAPGDDVILTWIKSSGIESATPEYRHNGRTINAGPITTFSNYSIVSENRVVPKPDGLEMDVAVLFGCALATGAGMALNEVDISSEDVIVVLGLGGVGMSTLMTLLAQGLSNIVGVDKDLEKCNLASSLGAKTLQFASESSLLTQLRKLYPQGVDYCFEAGGSVKSIELGFSLIKDRSGSLLFASHPPANEKISLDPHALISGKTIRGSWGGGLNPDTDIPRLTKLFCERDLPLRRLTTDRYSLKDINKAIALFAEGNVFRPIISMVDTGTS